MLMQKTDAGHVADFKNKAGSGFMIEAHEAAAVVRYIQTLEAKIAQLVLEKPNQFSLKPMTNAEAQVQAMVHNANANSVDNSLQEFTGRFGPDCGPGVPGCSDCEGGRCTMDCGGRAQAQKIAASNVKIND